MAERREFLGAMLALFAGVALPEPVRELIRVQPVLPLDSFYGISASPNASLEGVWRKVQVGVFEAYKFGVEEWAVLNPKDFKVGWYAREISPV